MIGYNQDYFSSFPFATLSGNHEISGSGYETFKHFNVPANERDAHDGVFYFYDYGNTRFIMLNTNLLSSNELTRKQYNWLVEVLKNNHQKWTIVAMHNPMYSVGVYGSNPERNQIALALRNQLGNLFAEYNVDLVLQGHDHVYSKTYPIGLNGVANKNLNYETINGIKYCTNPNGVIYAMNGPAGNQTRDPYEIDESLYEFASQSKSSSWAEIEITDNLLTVKVYYYDHFDNKATGTLWKSYGIKK